jgi:hypothetical protein
MIKVSVMYANTPGARFNHEYYRDKHMPLVKKRLGDACPTTPLTKGLPAAHPAYRRPTLACATSFVIPPSSVKPKGHLLPFCSHTIKRPQRTRTNDNQERIENCSSFRTFFARSEGCRHGLKTTHNPKAPGATQAPEIPDGLRGLVRPAPRGLCTNRVRTRCVVTARPRHLP